MSRRTVPEADKLTASDKLFLLLTGAHCNSSIPVVFSSAGVKKNKISVHDGYLVISLRPAQFQRDYRSYLILQALSVDYLDDYNTEA